MKRLLRFVVVLVVALALVQFLPLYIERTMLRSWRMDHAGDVIDWGWKICSLRDYWADYQYIRPEQSPALWLAVNPALALVYGLVIAFIVDRVLLRWRWQRAATAK
jgi:hypothetical protein